MSAPFRVLVVDDNEDHRYLTGRAIRSLSATMPVQVEAADGGEAALVRLHAGPKPEVDLVLLDLKMHGLDGIETLARLRSDPRTRDLRVVLFSSSEHRSDREKALAAGADEVVTKPIAGEAFDECVRDVVRRAAARRSS